LEHDCQQNCRTQDRILDSAERLFAENGYGRTSLRDITSDAGVNLAAVNYHFGSKEELVRRVFERKMSMVNSVRIEGVERTLQQAEQENRSPKVRELLLAFVIPTVELGLSNPQARNFISLVWRAMGDPEGTLGRHFIDSARPSFRILHQAVCKALPGRDPQSLLFSLIVGMTAMGTVIVRLSADTAFPFFTESQKEDFRQWVTKQHKLIDFISAGMEA